MCAIRELRVACSATSWKHDVNHATLCASASSPLEVEALGGRSKCGNSRGVASSRGETTHSPPSGAPSSTSGSQSSDGRFHTLTAPANGTGSLSNAGSSKSGVATTSSAFFPLMGVGSIPLATSSS